MTSANVVYGVVHEAGVQVDGEAVGRAQVDALRQPVARRRLAVRRRVGERERRALAEQRATAAEDQLTLLQQQQEQQTWRRLGRTIACLFD